ncbi:hypothetical protein HD554DRAFT_682431 [Boletus coccyginus]|nr:hypothetical protein HD554DRAFT_682431 [Boletus coccyginus]
MNTADPQSALAKTITIKDIELCTPAPRKLLVPRQFYVKFSVGAVSRSTSTAKETKNRTFWEEIFYFDGDDLSVFLVNVYQKHRIGKDKLVGSLTDTIGGVLGKLRNGVLQDTLGKDTSDGTDLSGITIKFALVAEPHENVTADERQAADAVAAATTAVVPLSSNPAAIDFLSSAVGAGTNAVPQAQSTWNLLLERIELFDKIVTDIAKIHPYASLAWSVISAANKVLVNQKNRDDQIIRLAGTMSDVFTFVHDTEPLKTIKAHIKTITLLIQQVAECGYFIIEYIKQKNFCQSPLG